jgi:hypothetical protein
MLIVEANGIPIRTGRQLISILSAAPSKQVVLLRVQFPRKEGMTSLVALEMP